MTKLFFLLQHKPFEVELLPNPEKVKLIVVDLFAGAGGTSWGLQNAKDAHGNRLVVVAVAINHNQRAIESHAMNMPKTIHFIEDVRSVKVELIKDIVDAYKKVYVNAEVMLWASAPCQEHSVAKAGQPLDADNRTLPNDLLRYIRILKPDRIGIENVKQFRDWGPLMASPAMEHTDVKYPYTELKTHIDRNTKQERVSYKPNPKFKGEFFDAWCRQIAWEGYEGDWVTINAADLGAYTSRDRLFGQFVRIGEKIHWPEKTYDRNGAEGLPKWKKARDILDLDFHGESIFNRPKRLAPATIGKILDELKKTVENKEDAHIHKYYGKGVNMSRLDEPIDTLRQKDCMYYIKVVYNQYGNSYMSSISEPLPPITVNPKSNILSYIYDPAYGGNLHNTEKPVCTIVASQGKAPLEYLSLEQGFFDIDVRRFLSEADIRYLEDGIGEKSIYLQMLEFCIQNGIRDIRKRGLTVKELLLAQGFPADYKFSGTMTDAKMFIGNSVAPEAAEKLAEAICLN